MDIYISFHYFGTQWLKCVVYQYLSLACNYKCCVKYTQPWYLMKHPLTALILGKLALLLFFDMWKKNSQTLFVLSWALKWELLCLAVPNKNWSENQPNCCYLIIRFFFCLPKVQNRFTVPWRKEVIFHLFVGFFYNSVHCGMLLINLLTYNFLEKTLQRHALKFSGSTYGINFFVFVWMCRLYAQIWKILEKDSILYFKWCVWIF